MESNETLSTIEKSFTDDNPLFNKIRFLNEMIETLRDGGVEEMLDIPLPRIVVLGSQSSGKSSVLESIVGIDFLPRGEGIKTRRPLELRLKSERGVAPNAKFEEVPDKLFENFEEVRQTIEKLTEDVCKGEKNIKDTPIVLTIYSESCPELTLVDLPGITKVPIGDQPKNIEEVTKNIVKKYCQDEMSFILCVIPANNDLSTSDGLQMAREIDPNGDRTLGVLTKLDIMDKGTNAAKILKNETIPLKHGYIAVKNRSEEDIRNNVPINICLQKEREFFKNHPQYSKLLHHCGMGKLIETLSDKFCKKAMEVLPNILNLLESKIRQFNHEIAKYGEGVPENVDDRIHMLSKMISTYCKIYKNCIDCRFDNERDHHLINEGGPKIRKIFESFLQDRAENYHLEKKDEEILEAIINHQESPLPGFTPTYGAFQYLITNNVQNLQTPIYKCFEDVFRNLEKVSDHILEKIFYKYPDFLQQIKDTVKLNFIKPKEAKVREMIDSIIETETTYFFTNDTHYKNNFGTFFKSQDNISDILEAHSQDIRTILIAQMKNRVEEYFKHVVRILRDQIPKTIGSQVKKFIDDLDHDLSYHVIKNPELSNNLKEKKSLEEARSILRNKIKVAERVIEKLKSNPDFNLAFMESQLEKDLGF